MNPANILSLINELKQTDLSKCDVSDLKKKAGLLFKKYAHTGVFLPVNWGKFHRARAIKHDEKPVHVNKLGQPLLAEDVKKVKTSRANFSGNPVFYCSGDPRATFFELGVKPGDTVVLSKWIMTKDILVSPVGYSEEAFSKLSSNRGCPIIVPNNAQHPQEFKKSNISINSFLNDQFTKIIPPGKEYLYNLTAAIAESFLTTTPECGIVYPAIAMQANAENLALTPTLVKHNLKLESATWYQVDEAKDFSYTLTSLSYANSFTNDQIEWRDPTEEERKYL